MKTQTELKQINEIVYMLTITIGDKTRDVFFEQFNCEPPSESQISFSVGLFEYEVSNKSL